MSDAEADMTQGVLDAKELSKLLEERGMGPDEGYKVIFDFELDEQCLTHEGVFLVGYSFKYDSFGYGDGPESFCSAATQTFEDVCLEYYERSKT